MNINKFKNKFQHMHRKYKILIDLYVVFKKSKRIFNINTSKKVSFENEKRRVIWVRIIY